MMFHRPLAWWLAVSGAALLLPYIPNGVLHLYLGKLVYARDLAVAAHLAFTLFCLQRTGHLRTLRRAIWPLVIFGAFLLPLAGSGHTRKDFLVNTKWVLLWLDALLTGYLVFLQRRFVKTLAAIAVAAFALFTADALIGLRELRTNSFFFAVAKDEETDAGVRVARSQQLASTVRMQGMQRDVFNFANFMGVGFVTSLLALRTLRSLILRVFASIGAAGFLYVAFQSGGRSVLFGMLLAFALWLFALLSRAAFLNHARQLLAAAVVGGSALCLLGLGPVLNSVFSLAGAQSRTFDLASTYERDAVWADRLQQMLTLPASFATGMPLASWAAGHLEPLTFADNQPLWLLFHTGLGGLAMLLLFFFRHARPCTREQHSAAYLALMLFLALVFGEGLARDTLFLFSALPMFLLLGFFLAADAYADSASPTPRDQ